MTEPPGVVIVGAGLAGLAAAVHLTRAGRNVSVLEASDGVGGRVRSDHVDGFVLDRGFQVLLTAYPEPATVMDLAALDLRTFQPGALVHWNGRWHEVGDPIRRPSTLFPTLRAPIGSIVAKTRTALLGVASRTWPAEGPVAGPNTSTAAWLAEKGLGGPMTERLLGPLFAGILLDPALETSSRQASFVWRSLANGLAAVPALGMGRISDQLASQLPADAVRLNCSVVAVEPHAVTVAGGTAIPASQVIVATDAPTAAGLLPGRVVDPGSKAVACLWYEAPSAPTSSRAILIDGERKGPVNNAAVMSNVSPTYAPDGKALVAASVLDPDAEGSDEDLERRVRAQLEGWWGDRAAVGAWRCLRVDRIAHAQPKQPPTSPFTPRHPVRIEGGLFVCGDHRDNPSIQGALVSGRRAAEAVIAG